MKRSVRFFREFHYKEAHFHIHTDSWDDVTDAIIKERNNLEAFILRVPQFFSSLVPLEIDSSIHLTKVALKMLAASRKTGLGPMAAVAGTMAQTVASISIKKGSSETIVENGGDIFLHCCEPVVLGLYPGAQSPFINLAIKISPEQTPLAVCTSSGRMGHSLSFGDCDIFTVFSKDASLADCAATLGCNSIKSKADMERVLNEVFAIDGVDGALAIRDSEFGAVGDIPELIKTTDPHLLCKVSKDRKSDFYL